jgi:hypothetical protein
MEKNINPNKNNISDDAKEALSLITEMEEKFPAEAAMYHNAKAYIEERGVVDKRFLDQIKRRKNELKIGVNNG